VALRRERAPEEYRQALESVRRQALHLRRLVDLLLFLARADGEARPLERERLDLTAWVPEHLRSWADHPRSADLRVDGAEAGPLWVEVPPHLLAELVNNLIDNACKYSRPGTPIRLRLSSGPETVALAVDDAGCGIAPEDQPHLFRPFFRSEQARRLGVTGVGLGLSIAARLAEALRAKLTVDSKVGRGSNFQVHLPQA
jgi:signal transduction histidine kinase